MTDIDELAEGCRARPGAPLSALWRLVPRFAAALRDHFRQRRAVARLSRLDARMLKDIGLYRGDLDTSALHRLARERREILDRPRR
ncbi:MAG: DUF1127 domain-containing protein [Hyphomicrobiales bacterium]|uniref:DUF1127 domain-containing protein n=1 Tax=Aestuariivirga sp. TaxID=2650926 RepID=UPI0035B324CA